MNSNVRESLRFTRSGAGVVLATLAASVAAPGGVLAQVAVQELDTVFVSAASRLPGGAVGRSVTILDRAALMSRPVGSVSDALRYVLGTDLQVRSPAQSDLSLRGASYEGVLVLVDGVRMSDPQTGHFDLDLAVPLERVERIEVLLGPGSALFGADAVGGVINVVTRDAGQGAEVRLEAGSFDRQLASGSARAVFGDWTSALGGEFSRSDGHREGTDYRILMLDGRGGGPLGGGRLEWSAGHARRNFGAADFYGPFPAYERTRATTASLLWNQQVGAVSIEPRALFRRHADDFILRRDDPAFYRNRHTSDQWGGDIVARVDLSGAQRLAVGTEWVRESLVSNNLGDRREDRRALFGEIVSGLGSARGTLGLRLDDHEGFDAVLSPSASVMIPVSGALRLRAAAGRAFRAPSWTERYYQDPANIGTPDLGPERSWAAEVGADASLAGGAVVRGTVFRRRSEDLIDWAKPDDQPTQPWRTRNVESATFDGLELNGSGSLGGWIGVSARAEWLRVEAVEEAGLVSKYALRPLVRTLGAGASVRLPVGLTVLTDLRRETRRGSPSVVLVDSRLAIPTAFGEVFLSGTNLSGASYPDLSGLPAQGRGLSVGLRTVTGSD